MFMWEHIKLWLKACLFCICIVWICCVDFKMQKRKCVYRDNQIYNCSVELFLNSHLVRVTALTLPACKLTHRKNMGKTSGKGNRKCCWKQNNSKAQRITTNHRLLLSSFKQVANWWAGLASLLIMTCLFTWLRSTPTSTPPCTKVTSVWTAGRSWRASPTDSSGIVWKVSEFS